MNRAARMVTTKTGITIGLLYQQRPPAPGFYAECIQRALLEAQPQRPTPLLLRVMRALAVRRREASSPRPRSRCDSLAGLCARDPACADRHCPGLHQRDGGMQVHGPLSFPIEHS